MMASWRTAATSSGVISGSGLAIAKMIGFGAIPFTISLVTAPLTDSPEEDVGARHGFGQRARRGLHGEAADFHLVHALGAAFDR